MAARCASCSYPLSVSDSVSCCECLSYFHIDCAQLVGFPYYELNSDPIRNTFHCQTCKILPLPQRSDSFSDSDSDECTMPSRQLDYHLEGQPDFVKDMNEVKGTVQDLSDLCKDMFREINELKSINLTLRCCVENIRHDGEQRDGIISELKRRIEALEGKGIVNVFKPIDTTDMYIDRISIEKEEDAERYLTPDPEYSGLKETESLDQGNCQREGISPADGMHNLTKPSLESKTSVTEIISERITLHKFEPSDTAIEIPYTETNDFVEEKSQEINEDNVHFAEEETSTAVGEDNSEMNAITTVKDWDWRGNEAIQVKKGDCVSSEEEESTDIEDTEAQGWEILDEEVKSEFVTKHYEEKASENSKGIEGSEEEVDEKRVTWADEVEKYEEKEGNKESYEEDKEPTPQSDTEYLTTNFEPPIESRTTFKGEETEETNEDETEEAERTSLKEDEEEDKSEEVLEILEEGVEVEDYIKAIYTGRVHSAEGSRLEGEPWLEGGSAAEEGAVPEGEGEGGQSPEVQGEVQPSELSEASEPPPPQHTPDDLWDYLKETVTGEHPATVEEFVQKLIGTLEHVPEEYLKPVIDYNIKRATTPSVTDGEHLEDKEGDQHLEGDDRGSEETGSGEARPQGGEALEAGDHPTTLPEGDRFPSGDAAALHEDTTNFPEEPSQSTEGYSALEAAS